jgi:hypothetical protein
VALGRAAWYDVGIVFFRKPKPRERAISEADAYARCHGDRGSDLISVTKRPAFELPQRRRGYRVSVPGETLRQAFAARLAARQSGH